MMVAEESVGAGTGGILVVDSLAALDRLPSEIDGVALFCWSDVRPLAGVAGLIDWRLGGALSRALEHRHFTGEQGEVMLLPCRGRLGRRRLFVFGLGRLADAAVPLGPVLLDVVRTLRRAGVERPAIAAPLAWERPTEATFWRAAAQAGVEALILASTAPASR